VLIGNLPAARATDMAVCVGPPDVIAKGSTIVLIGGMPAARLGDLTAHGGVITVGLPTVLIEALAVGAPVVSTDCETGPREIVRHGADGWLVPPDDPASLSAAMAMLMADEPLRLRLGANALEARQRHSLEAVEAQWTTFLSELDAARPAQRARA